MSETRIEPATIDDLPHLVELLRDLFTQEADFNVNREKQLRGLRLIIENPNRGRIFLLRNGHQILGMINMLITISTAEGGFVVLLEDLIIDPAHRGRGLGTLLLQHAIRYSKEKNFLRITLITDHPKHSSVRFFRKHGFELSDMAVMRLVFDRQTRNAPI